MIDTLQSTTSPAQRTRSGSEHALLIILALCISLYFVRLGSFGIAEGGESYYPAAVREMLEAGNMLVPRLNYQLYFSKPILTFWLIGSAYSIFGVNEFASRIWSAILSTVLVLFCYLTGRAVASTRAGLIAALCLASSPLLLGTCRRSSVDIFFSCFLGMAICSTIMVLFGRRKNWWPVIHVALALAVLTKGPVGIVLYCLGAFGFLLANRSGWNQIKEWGGQLKVLPGAALFALIVVPWFVAIGLATKWMFLKVFFVYENLSRFAGHTNSKHSYPGWYLLTVAYGLFPWCLYLPNALWETIQLSRQKWRTRQTGTDLGADEGCATEPICDTTRGNALLFSASCGLAVLGFFSLSKVQFETYVLPAWCPLAILIGLCVDQWMGRAEISGTPAKVLKMASWSLLVLGPLISIAAGSAALFYQPLHLWMKILLPVAGATLLFGWTRQFLLLRRGQLQMSMLTLLISTCIGFSIITPIAVETWYQVMFADAQNLVRSLENTDAQVGQFHEYMLSLLFYRKGPVDFFYNPEELVPRATCPASKSRGARSPLLIIVRKDHLSEITYRPGLHFKQLDRSGDWILLQSSDAVLQRPPTLEWMFGNETIKDMLTDRFHLQLTMPYGGGELPARLLKLGTAPPVK